MKKADVVKIVKWYMITSKNPKVLGATIIKVKVNFFKSYYALWSETGAVKEFLPGGQYFLGYTKKDAFHKYQNKEN